MPMRIIETKKPKKLVQRVNRKNIQEFVNIQTQNMLQSRKTYNNNNNNNKNYREQQYK